MKKRLLASVMSLCMILSLLPVSVFASDDAISGDAICICDTKCAEDSVNENCEVCKADFALCEATTEQTEDPTKGEENQGNQNDPDGSKEEGQDNADSGEPSGNQSVETGSDNNDNEGPGEGIEVDSSDPEETAPTTTEETSSTPTGETAPTTTEATGEPAGEPVPYAEGAVYVSNTGDDATGNGSEGTPYATLAKAVDAAEDGATIYLLNDIEANSRTLVNGKTLVIDGQGNTVTRAEDFTRAQDEGRGGYHSAMIEVANRSTLTLKNITLDDKFLREADKFELAGPSTEDNTDKVHDGIIASYGDGKSTIILGEGATLKNFGGLAAVYITGEGGEGAKLIMESGSKICDDNTGSRQGGYAAIFNHGGTVEAETGSSIESIDGRAIYADNGGVTTFAGSIKNITSSEAVKQAADAGVAYYGSGNTVFTLASGGLIEDIKSHDGTAADSALHLIGCTFKTEKDSSIQNLSVGVADMDGATVDLAGSLTNCDAKDVFFRLRGTQGTFTLQKTGSITKCNADTALIYLNGGQPTVTIAGTIDDINVTALFMSNNGPRKDGTITLTQTGVITNITGYGMRLEDPSKVTIEGTITNCSNYALQYFPKGNQSLLTIESTATIENNNGGKAQIRAQNTLPAMDAQEHIVVEPGGLDGNKTIDLTAFDVTLDDDYQAVKLGNAGSAAAAALKDAITAKYPDWKPVGSSAVWIQPSESEIHFTVPRTSSMKKTALFAALIPLNTDGTPVSDANGKLILQEVGNTDPVDVTLPGLTPDQSYAMMFVNNNIYTLAPDDITIYTGGGQGNEDATQNNGFPALTITNSVDEIESLTIDKQDVTEGDLMAALLSRLEVTYTDENGDLVDNDAEAGEYTATLSWRKGQEPTSIRINGNEVAKDFGTGTLIVRYTEDIEEAIEGSNTHALLTDEPTTEVTHAEAVATKFLGILSPSFYTNDDEDRKVDADGIQLLDDSLLIDEDGTDRQELLEEKAEASDLLKDLGEEQAYRYEFHYLDLVDAHNGNAWVSASYGTTVYLPYPDDMTKAEAESSNVQVIHFPGLHREYGIAGQAEVTETIAACEPEEMPVTLTDEGIKFDVDRSGFSPFAIVWQTEAHTITSTAGTGGSIDPSGAVAVAKGADKTFTIKANSGYEIADVLVDGQSVGAVSTYKFENVQGDRTISATFRQTGGTNPGGGNQGGNSGSGGGSDSGDSDPTGNLSISLDVNGGDDDFTFTVILTDKNGDDLENNFYFNGDFTGTIGSGDEITLEGGDKIVIRNLPEGTRYEVIIETADGYTYVIDGEEGVIHTGMNEAEFTATRTVPVADPSVTGVSRWLNTTDHIAYLTGYPGGAFGPDNNMTRAEVAQMFYALLNNKNVTITKTFPDVPADAWYATAVNTLASLGMVSGDENGNYRPNDPITRAEFCVIALAFAYEPENAVCYFGDVSRSDWFYTYVAQAASYGWIGGYTNGNFGPNDRITRAQVTTIVNNMLGRAADRDYVIDHQADLVQFTDLTRAHWGYFQIMEATNAHDYTKSNGTENWR